MLALTQSIPCATKTARDLRPSFSSATLGIVGAADKESPHRHANGEGPKTWHGRRHPAAIPDRRSVPSTREGKGPAGSCA